MKNIWNHFENSYLVKILYKKYLKHSSNDSWTTSTKENVFENIFETVVFEIITLLPERFFKYFWLIAIPFVYILWNLHGVLFVSRTAFSVFLFFVPRPFDFLPLALKKSYVLRTKNFFIVRLALRYSQWNGKVLLTNCHRFIINDSLANMYDDFEIDNFVKLFVYKAFYHKAFNSKY